MAISKLVRDQLLALPVEERLALADDLYDSVEVMDPAWQGAWTSELDRRLDDVASNRVELIDADVVHAELLADLANAR